ncbi:MAG: hypothetical protein ACHBN1_21260 [Heteroscytonema crispum UTEX LB 1556]
MYRLNNRAFEILRAEVQKCSGDDELSKTERQIVMKRLEKMRLEKGSPAKLDQLRDAVIDMYPQFNEKVLNLAAQTNQPPSAFSQFISKITWMAILLTGSAGVVWFINLPYPMIRRPVAEKAPILLLPSFLSMDRSYRGAISSLEQAEQLLNKATSPADIEWGIGHRASGIGRRGENLLVSQVLLVSPLSQVLQVLLVSPLSQVLQVLLPQSYNNLLSRVNICYNSQVADV